MHMHAHTHACTHVVAGPNTPKVQMDPNSNIWNNQHFIKPLET